MGFLCTQPDVNNDSFIFSFLILIFFVSLSCFNSLSSVTRTMWNGYGGVATIFLLLIFKGTLLMFYHYDVRCRLWVDNLNHIKRIPFYFLPWLCQEFFFFLIVNRCGILSTVLWVPIEMSVLFSPVLMWWIMFRHFLMVTTPVSPE